MGFRDGARGCSFSGCCESTGVGLSGSATSQALTDLARVLRPARNAVESVRPAAERATLDRAGTASDIFLERWRPSRFTALGIRRRAPQYATFQRCNKPACANLRTRPAPSITYSLDEVWGSDRRANAIGRAGISAHHRSALGSRANSVLPATRAESLVENVIATMLFASPWHEVSARARGRLLPPSSVRITALFTSVSRTTRPTPPPRTFSPYRTTGPVRRHKSYLKLCRGFRGDVSWAGPKWLRPRTSERPFRRKKPYAA